MKGLSDLKLSISHPSGKPSLGSVKHQFRSVSGPLSSPPSFSDSFLSDSATSPVFPPSRSSCLLCSSISSSLSDVLSSSTLISNL